MRIQRQFIVPALARIPHAPIRHPLLELSQFTQQFTHITQQFDFFLLSLIHRGIGACFHFTDFSPGSGFLPLNRSRWSLPFPRNLFPLYNAPVGRLLPPYPLTSLRVPRIPGVFLELLLASNLWVTDILLLPGDPSRVKGARGSVDKAFDFKRGLGAGGGNFNPRIFTIVKILPRLSSFSVVNPGLTISGRGAGVHSGPRPLLVH